MTTKKPVVEERVWRCVYTEHNQTCPVRGEFKLQPENLVLFCEFCPIRMELVKKAVKTF